MLQAEVGEMKQSIRLYGLNKYAASQNGVTLTELLVSIAIIVIVAAPFLGSFLSATRNNVASQERLAATAIAQQQMESLKASNKADLVSIADKDTLVADISGFTVSKKVQTQAQGTLSDGGMSFASTSFSIPDTQNLFEIRDKLTVKSEEFNLADKEFELDILSNGCKFYDRSDPSQVTTFGSGSDFIIKFSGSTNSVFNLFVNSSVDGITFYVLDNPATSRLKIVNIGSKEFNYYDNLSSTAQSSYSNTLYRINIDVEKKGINLARLESYVKK